MKLLLENWRKYLNEDKNTIYYWQTRGLWKSDTTIEFGVTHVPQARPRERADGLIEEIFEEVRKKSFSDRPSRLNCVFLCDNLEGYSGGSYCRDKKEDIYGEPVETYKVELRGGYNIFKADSENWTAAISVYDEYGEGGLSSVRDWAETYWEGVGRLFFGEILVSPPEAAIIVGRHE